MCLAVPFEIKEINGNEAIACRAGIARTVRIDFIKDAKPGDHVLVHAGFAIEKVRRDQAEEDLETARELEEELKKIAAQINERQVKRNAGQSGNAGREAMNG